MTQYNRPNIEYSDELTIEINDISSEHLPHALMALKDALKMPDFQLGSIELPALPKIELPSLPSPPPQEVPRVGHESERENHAQNKLPRNGQRKAIDG
mgnify:CR=1 FL=1